MTEKPEWPEDGYLIPSEHRVDPRVAEQSGLPKNIREIPVTELERTLRFDDWGEVAADWKKLLLELDIEEARRLLAELLTHSPMPLLVLQTKFAILDSSRIIKRLMELINNLQSDHEKPLPLNERNLRALAKLSHQAKNSLNGIIKTAGQTQEPRVDEESMHLPQATTALTKAFGSEVLPAFPEEEKMELAIREIKVRLNQFAAGTFALTFRDIHGMSKSLHDLEVHFTDVFKQFDQFRIFLEDMRKKDVDSLDGFFELFNFEGKVESFQTKQATLVELLRIFLWRMDSINKPSNDLFADEYTPEDIMEIYNDTIRPMRERIRQAAPSGLLDQEQEPSNLERLLGRMMNKM